MEILSIDLGIDYKNLKKGDKDAVLTGFILKKYPYCENRKNPAVIICSGGSYTMNAQRAMNPVAIAYASKGISAFVLEYSVKPAEFPTSLVELAKTVKIIRENAEKWNIDPDKIVVCGFSAGGHLAGCLGVFWNTDIVRNLGFDGDAHKPNALILGYPLISFGEKWHEKSTVNLLGENVDKMRELMSIENHVTKDLPPIFLWHSSTDTQVSCEHSMMFATEAVKHGVKTELHIYPQGDHAVSLATDLVIDAEKVVKNVSTWHDFSVDFIFGL